MNDLNSDTDTVEKQKNRLNNFQVIRSNRKENDMYIIQGDYAKTIQKCNELFAADYFEFEFQYVSKDSVFRELDRFVYEARHSRRFAGEYRGNVVIDISAWNQKNTNSYFDAFLYYLKDNSDKLNCIIISQERCNEQLMEKLRSLFEVTPILLGSPHETHKFKIGFGDCNNKEA